MPIPLRVSAGISPDFQCRERRHTSSLPLAKAPTVTGPMPGRGRRPY